MKKAIFNQYAYEVSKLFSLDQKEIFNKGKRRDIVGSRHMLFYLCYKRGMYGTEIKKYMNDSGYNINHSSIMYGVKCANELIQNDKDYASLIRKVSLCVD
jgi:chromosomal replication initiation ATPase DnaA|tara:strand:- start:106 stop:405 length:300 start_codon:yes stop_codon:yes gene_type:complete